MNRSKLTTLTSLVTDSSAGNSPKVTIFAGGVLSSLTDGRIQLHKTIS
jgi:hypothetical protein